MASKESLEIANQFTSHPDLSRAIDELRVRDLEQAVKDVCGWCNSGLVPRYRKKLKEYVHAEVLQHRRDAKCAATVVHERIAALKAEMEAEMEAENG